MIRGFRITRSVVGSNRPFYFFDLYEIKNRVAILYSPFQSIFPVLFLYMYYMICIHIPFYLNILQKANLIYIYKTEPFRHLISIKELEV